jgi:hypothetical protein
MKIPDQLMPLGPDRLERAESLQVLEDEAVERLPRDGRSARKLITVMN